MKLHELAKFLYEKETITGEEFMDILFRQESPCYDAGQTDSQESSEAVSPDQD